MRYRAFVNDKTQQPKKNVSRIIVFIIGGVTFSEIRSAYDITKNFTNWEVIIGKKNMYDIYCVILLIFAIFLKVHQIS